MKTSRMLSSEQVIINVPDLKLLAIGDCHFPFVDTARATAVINVAKKLKPNVIVQIGDLYDLYTFSRFAKSVDYITPKDELLLGKQMATDFWARLRKAAPKAQCFQLRGNHSWRIVKALLDKAPEYESLLDGPISSLTEFEGVRDMKNHRSELIINDIVIIHGWSIKLGFHRDYYGQSVICGHSHHGGVSFKARKKASIYELNCGHIADETKLPLQYGETKTTSWIAGCGWVDTEGPRFLPL